MIQTFNGSENIGDIVTVFPGASNVFKAYGIDFCCGGGRPLTDAITKQQLDASEVLERLNAAFVWSKERGQSGVDWQHAPYGEMIDHIVDTHHAFLQKELPVLGEFTTKILRVHGAGHPELAKVHKLFHELKMELEQHLIKEEELVFPLIKEFEASGAAETKERIRSTIDELESEHSAAGDILKELRRITQDYTLPEGACRTYTLTFQKLEELESDLFQHIHLENNILFPRVTQ